MKNNNPESFVVPVFFLCLLFVMFIMYYEQTTRLKEITIDVAVNNKYIEEAEPATSGMLVGPFVITNGHSRKYVIIFENNKKFLKEYFAEKFTYDQYEIGKTYSVVFRKYDLERFQ